MGGCSWATAVCAPALLLASTGALGPDSDELWAGAPAGAASATANAPPLPRCMELSNAFGDHMVRYMVLHRAPERAVVYSTVRGPPPKRY